jgi:hypothetical protein
MERVSTSPERYRFWCQDSDAEISREPNGGWVRHSDYEALERQIAELRAALREIAELEGQAGAGGKAVNIAKAALSAENARLKALPLKDEVERVLETFADAANHYDGFGITDEMTTSGANLPIGSFRAARALLSRLRAGEQEGWRRGPYGYLIKPIGLNEEHWHLAIEPSAYPDEEVSVPLYADQDQLPASPSVSDGGSRNG